ncbi:MAG TPA: DUF6152 family protein [Gammaproteobacteria bacterium]
METSQQKTTGVDPDGIAPLRCVILASLAMFSCVPAINAHHSAAAVFDMSNLVSVTGTVSRLELTNPHALVYLSATGNDGATEEWIVEMPGKLSLARRGWTDETLEPGATLTATGHPARDGSPMMWWQRIRLEDGSELLFPALADQLAIEEQRRERLRRASGD